jgi:hypothetical protein
MYYQQLLDEPIPMDVDDDRKTISAPVRSKVWNTYIGEAMGSKNMEVFMTEKFFKKPMTWYGKQI